MKMCNFYKLDWPTISLIQDRAKRLGVDVSSLISDPTYGRAVIDTMADHELAMQKIKREKKLKAKNKKCKEEV